MSELVVTDLAIEMQRYQRAMETARRLAREVDSANRDVVDSANRMEQALNNIKSSIKFEVDATGITDAESNLNRLSDETIDVRVGVTGTQALVDAAQTVQRIDSAPQVDIGVSGEQTVASAASNAKAIDYDPTVDIGVTGEQTLSDANTNAKAIDSTPTVAVTTTGGDDVKEIKNDLAAIKAIGAIDLALNVKDRIGSTAELVSGIPIVGQINDTKAALRELEVATGKVIPGAEQLINGLYTRWGDSTPAIAANIAAVENLAYAHKDLESDVVSTYEAARVRGKEFNEQLMEADKLVASGLAPNLRAANDALIYGMRIGADQNGDIGGTIEEFASQYAQLNVSAAEFMFLSAESFRVGARNSELLGDSFLETTGIINEALSTKEGEAYEWLVDLQLTDDAQQLVDGEINGVEFAANFTRTVNERLAAGTLTLPDAFTSVVKLFGSPAQNFGVEQFLKVDFEAAKQAVVPEGAAQAAADELTNTFGASIGELRRVLEKELAASFKIAGMPLTEALDLAKAKAQEIADLVSGGMSVLDAIEVSLVLPGFADSVRDFQSGVGNAVIGFEQIIAEAMRVLNIGDKGESLREDIKERSYSQLQFDLKFADNEPEMARAVQRALDRGVDASRVEDATTNVVQELLVAGEVARAQSLVAQASVAPESEVFLKYKPAGGNIFQSTEETRKLEGITAQSTVEEQSAAIDRLIEELRAQGVTGMIQVGDVTSREAIDITAAQAEIDQYSTAKVAALTNLFTPLEPFAGMVERVTAQFNDPFIQSGGWANNAILPATPTQPTSMVTYDANDNIVKIEEYQATVATATEQSVADFQLLSTEAQTAFSDTALAAGDSLTAITDTEAAATSLGTVGVAGMAAFADGSVEQAGRVKSEWDIATQAIQATIDASTNAGGLSSAANAIISAATGAKTGGVAPPPSGGNSTVNNVNMTVINNNTGAAARSGSDLQTANMLRGRIG